MNSETLEYLRSREWSFGNGQCPECLGVPASWHGHPCHLEAATIGHKHDCRLAKILADAGDQPLMQGQFSDVDFEVYVEKIVDAAGVEHEIFSTRPREKATP